MRALAGLLVCAAALLSCRSTSKASCGERPDDWCTAVSGDPCAKHTDAKACEADPKCEALSYRGESAAACMTDDRCFASNCPAIGCITRCEELSASDCLRDEVCLWKGQRGSCSAGEHRCKQVGSKCVRALTCIYGMPRK
ncbi:MAG: hypothetical protein H6717_40590 [Polyangiaceae bacterium]|nr:hypothetical protein [Polyangiaceae bacterium]